MLPDRLLTIILNLGPQQSPKPLFDLAPWLSGAGKRQLTVYNEDGEAIARKKLKSLQWTMAVGLLKHGEMKILEIKCLPVE